MKKEKFRLKISFKEKSLAIESIRLYSYIRENWGAPFIITFMVMLIICACLLASGNEAFANEVAVYAYYSLVIGVVLQLVTFIKEERGKLKNADEPRVENESS